MGNHSKQQQHASTTLNCLPDQDSLCGPHFAMAVDNVNDSENLLPFRSRTSSLSCSMPFESLCVSLSFRYELF